MVHKRRAIAVIGAAALLLFVVHSPQINIRLLTHDRSDPAPHRMQAAVDLGFAAFSLLITWTSHAGKRSVLA